MLNLNQNEKIVKFAKFVTAFNPGHKCVNALNTITCRFDDFVSLVRDKIDLQKYIAVTCNKVKEFRNEWKFFLSL